METRDSSVKNAVWAVVNKIITPGQVVTRTVWRAAYQLARLDAIRETVAWKKKYITIEEPWI